MQKILSGAFAVLCFVVATTAIQHRLDSDRLLAQQNDLIRQQQDMLETVFGCKFDLEKARTLPVTVTAYCSDPEQTDNTPHVTASMTTVRPGTMAVSRDLLENYGLKYGQVVVLRGYGAMTVADTMNPRWLRRVDVWTGDREAALRHGTRESVLLWIDSGGQNES